MNWKELKRHVYHEDGSLRDIYIRNVTTDDWKRWVDFVNTNHAVDFKIGGELKGNRIDFDTVASFWQDPDQECPSASIFLGHIIVNTFFFQETEIENDITPREIKSLQDHESLVKYLQDISLLLNKPVEVTEENPDMPKEILMIVDSERVTFLR